MVKGRSRNSIVYLMIVSLGVSCLLEGCTPMQTKPVDGKAGNVTGQVFHGMNDTPELSYVVPEDAPHILIDRAGYESDHEKTAVFQSKELPESFEVVDASTGETVYEGTVKEKGTSGGIKIGYGDFSEVEEEGIYYLQNHMLGQSFSFEIQDSLYETLLKEALQGLAQTQEKKINVLLPTKDTEEKILSGGWFTDNTEAQDLAVSAETMMPLLLAYELYPSSFQEENRENTPELLVLLKKETDWMQQLQDEKTGGVYGGILEKKQGETSYRMKSLDIQGTLCYAAAMAKFSYTFQKYDQQYAAFCLKAADLAWKYVIKNSTEEDREKFSDRLFCAAAELYRASGQAGYHAEVKKYLELAEKSGMASMTETSHWYVFGSITYLSTRHSVSLDSCNAMMKRLMNRAEDISEGARAGLYMTEAKSDLPNTDELLWNMVILVAADYVITNHEYATVIENHQHFLMGCNPTGTCEQPSGLLEKAYYICMLSHMVKQET